MKIRASRSLKATPEGIKKANQAVLRFATKIDLAADAEVSRATVQNFFAGKPIGRENFHKICQQLQIPWQEVAELPENYYNIETKEVEVETDNIDEIIVTLQQKIQASIQQKCGIVRVLDMSQPRELQEIYTNVNILEKISSRRWLAVEQLQKNSAKESGRLSLDITKQRISGLKAVNSYSKLIILGKPGAGKTTFLKHITMQCAFGQIYPDKIPIFITLKDFAENQQEYSLLTYIHQELAYYGITNALVINQILIQGRAIILLDGLDEVRQKDVYRVVQQIRQFSTDYHDNHFVITCRLASREYALEQFTEVELANFDQQQIALFVHKWFRNINATKSSQFMLRLQQNQPLQDLATNPLLLTLLCLIFAEAGDFPTNRIELYQEALNILLKKWDAKRYIERDQIYKHLSIQRKQELLSYIAWKTFERGEYFFKQQQVEQYIAEYLRSLPDLHFSNDSYDTEALLKTVEAQHGLLIEQARGIYSFSHLTFQEYFTAKYIVSAVEPQTFVPTLAQLVEHINDKRWREVFLLSAGMLPQADYLLLLSKRYVDALLAHDSQLQQFLEWNYAKSQTVNDSHPLVTLRAFYFDLELARACGTLGSSLELARAFDRNFTRQLSCELALDLALDRLLTVDYVIENAAKPCLVYHRVLERAIARASAVGSSLEQVLQQMKVHAEQHAQDDEKMFRNWWNVCGEAEIAQLRSAIIAERNFGYIWHFSRLQKDLLQQYYYANVLLINCLNSHAEVAPSCYQEIHNTMLLPLCELHQVAVS